MTTPIMGSKKPERTNPTLIIIGFILLVAVGTGVIWGIAWLFTVAVPVPFWNAVAFTVAVIACVAIGTRVGSRK